MATIPLTFASVMGGLFKFRLDLPTLAQTPVPQVWSHIIYEAERLNPNLAVRMRYCETQTTLPSGALIDQGEWVVSLIAAASSSIELSLPICFSMRQRTRGPAGGVIG